MKPILTIFTPTYNRAHTIGRTYESLKKQNCKEFIWLIIDDGSTDNTSKLVEQWKNESCGFEIRYIYKENGGMHTAHNIAYENILMIVLQKERLKRFWINGKKLRMKITQESLDWILICRERL